MNKIYKVIFSKARRALTVVSEMTSSVQSKGTKTVVAAPAAAVVRAPAWRRSALAFAVLAALLGMNTASAAEYAYPLWGVSSGENSEFYQNAGILKYDESTHTYTFDFADADGSNIKLNSSQYTEAAWNELMAKGAIGFFSDNVTDATTTTAITDDIAVEITQDRGVTSSSLSGIYFGTSPVSTSTVASSGSFSLTGGTISITDTGSDNSFVYGVNIDQYTGSGNTLTVGDMVFTLASTETTEVSRVNGFYQNVTASGNTADFDNVTFDVTAESSGVARATGVYLNAENTTLNVSGTLTAKVNVTTGSSAELAPADLSTSIAMGIYDGNSGSVTVGGDYVANISNSQARAPGGCMAPAFSFAAGRPLTFPAMRASPSPHTTTIPVWASPTATFQATAQSMSAESPR